MIPQKTACQAHAIASHEQHPRRDSGLRSSDEKSDALSTRPRGLCAVRTDPHPLGGRPFLAKHGRASARKGAPPPLRFACHAAKWQFRRTCRRMKDSPCRAKSMAPRGLAPRIFLVLAERSDQQSYETSGRHFLHDTFITAWVGGQRGSAFQVTNIGLHPLLCCGHCSLSRSRYYSRSRR